MPGGGGCQAPERSPPTHSTARSTTSSRPAAIPLQSPGGRHGGLHAHAMVGRAVVLEGALAAPDDGPAARQPGPVHAAVVAARGLAHDRGPAVLLHHLQQGLAVVEGAAVGEERHLAAQARAPSDRSSRRWTSSGRRGGPAASRPGSASWRCAPCARPDGRAGRSKRRSAPADRRRPRAPRPAAAAACRAPRRRSAAGPRRPRPAGARPRRASGVSGGGSAAVRVSVTANGAAPARSIPSSTREPAGPSASSSRASPRRAAGGAETSRPRSPPGPWPPAGRRGSATTSPGRSSVPGRARDHQAVLHPGPGDRQEAGRRIAAMAYRHGPGVLERHQEPAQDAAEGLRGLAAFAAPSRAAGRAAVQSGAGRDRARAGNAAESPRAAPPPRAVPRACRPRDRLPARDRSSGAWCGRVPAASAQSASGTAAATPAPRSASSTSSGRGKRGVAISSLATSAQPPRRHGSPRRSSR